MADSKSIKNWLEDERPREKMIQKGAASLTDAELLAILISSGTKERSALDLARDILILANNNILELGRLSISELQKVKGIGMARAITISAALEIGRRRQTKEGTDLPKIISSKDASQILIPMLQDLSHEIFVVIYLNSANKFIKAEKISDGGSSTVLVDIRLALKNAIMLNAAKIIIAHNHPNADAKPSMQDKSITEKIKEATQVLDIKLIDHLIIAGNKYFSFTDEGLL